ncbi:protein DGS1, mitochondrial isoform X3 [Dendrobium catenatum]|uniref:protein DGS1, mitochondrial isoform X3 n=1 Tax=Dendrobium catenatum TaxID=906689 RepID=UPI00109F6CD1|nr:protein DGS1, mitochondrial isoform X3 [Dendrobium catenatum]
MASSQSENPNTEGDSAKALIYSYSNRTWRAFLDLLPSRDLSLLAKISNLYPQGLTAGFRKRRSGLPLLLYPNALHSSPVAAEASRIFVILEDIRAHTLSNLHKIHKSLAFWQARAVETDYQKVWFMVFNRGPRAFIYESFQIIRKLATYGHPFQSITHSAVDTISLKIAILTTLQRCLATFLAQVYLEVNKFGELLIADPDKSLLPLLAAIDNLFCKLEASISHPSEIYNLNNDSLSMGSGNSCALLFEKLPNMEHVETHWTDTEIRDSTSLIHQNLQRLDSYLSFMLISIRDELFETFRKRHKGVMEMEEVQLTANSLHRMLLAFSEQTKGQKLPENLTDQEMMEIVMSRYEKEVMHPLQNLIGGELARAMLIQIQKLKLDLETAMLELDQILKANEINFAVLAALPAFFISIILLYLVRTWVLQDKGEEGRGRVARIRRRLLLVEVEEWIMQFQVSTEQGMEEDAAWIFGMMIYSLDLLCKAVEKNAKETHEWPRLRQDIIKLMKTEVQIDHKLAVISRMGRMYDCLLPYSKQR